MGRAGRGCVGVRDHPSSPITFPSKKDVKVKLRKSYRGIGSFLSSLSTFSWRSRCKIGDYGAHLKNFLWTKVSSRRPLLKIIWRSGRSGICWKMRRRGIHICPGLGFCSEEDHLEIQLHEDTVEAPKCFRSIMATTPLVYLAVYLVEYW